MINGRTASHKRTQDLFISVHLMGVVSYLAMLNVTVKNLYVGSIGFQPKGFLLTFCT